MVPDDGRVLELHSCLREDKPWVCVLFGIFSRRDIVCDSEIPLESSEPASPVASFGNRHTVGIQSNPRFKKQFQSGQESEEKVDTDMSSERISHLAFVSASGISQTSKHRSLKQSVRAIAIKVCYKIEKIVCR